MNITAIFNALAPQDNTERTHHGRSDNMQDPNFPPQQQQPIANQQDNLGAQNFSHTTVCFSLRPSVPLILIATMLLPRVQALATPTRPPLPPAPPLPKP